MYWESGAGWKSLLFHMPGRNFNCLKISEAWSALGGSEGLMHWLSPRTLVVKHAAWAWWVIPNWGAGTPFLTTQLPLLPRGGCSCPRFVWLENNLQIIVWGKPLSWRQTSWCGEYYPRSLGSLLWRILDQSFSNMSKHMTLPPQPARPPPGWSNAAGSAPTFSTSVQSPSSVKRRPRQVCLTLMMTSSWCS